VIGAGCPIPKAHLYFHQVGYAGETLPEDTEGDIDAISLWAGQGLGLVKKLQPAAEIVHEIDDDAFMILKRLGTMSG
jgi:NAD(P)H-dependent flavin oxidoreductase YrpB (nitropropane dioxygenase family)